MKNKNWLIFILAIMFCGAIIFGSADRSLGDDGFYVIAAGRKLKNIITVAKAGGNFTDPVAAVNSITDASETNPYLVVIAPGVYTITQTLVMKNYVDVTGSGQDVTKLTGAISTQQCYNTSAIVDLEVHATLSNMSVENTGGGKCSVGIIAYHSTLHDVSASARGGTENFGVFASDATLEGVSAEASGGTFSVGIDIHSGELKRVNAKASGTDQNMGIRSYFGSALTITEVVATASGGAESYGIYFFNVYPRAEMTQVTATASGGTEKNFGVYQGITMYWPPLIIRRSTVSGTTNGVYVENFSDYDVGTAKVSQSTIIGSVGGRPMECVACDDGAGGALGADCF